MSHHGTPVLSSSGLTRLTTFFFIHASRGAAEEIARRDASLRARGRRVILWSIFSLH